MSKKDEKGEKGKKDEKDMRPVKILLILDNIWKDLDLATVGIPSGDDRGGCKLLLTTRVRDVLDRMGSTNNFKMGTLNEEEAWNLFQKMAGANLTMEKARNRLNKLVRELKDLCLLLEGSRSKQFSMHDVIRAIAITIAYTDHHVFTERNDIEKEWKDKDKLRKCTKICLPGDDVIYDSKIKDVAIIGKLKKLKVLSLRNADIGELPIEMGQLTQLRLLDLSNCRGLEVIAPNVIPKLSQLEELYVSGCHIQCKVEVLKELKDLSKLASLEIDIEDNKMLPKDFFSKELKRYNISIELGWFHPYKWANYEPSRILALKYDANISLEELRIFRNVEILQLTEVSNDDNNLSPLFNEKV
ncbi:hypothetical protein Patl1_24236 [Pistacia atlantica]|uniref:Uncharacterized protein n=1 Tax=Pistacia atlantica TaxID=434234 RepID=A0ACC1A016_9ROSI|nr:hypothetical protein Patl1_24236 [Pistacia atlantica]